MSPQSAAPQYHPIVSPCSVTPRARSYGVRVRVTVRVRVRVRVGVGIMVRVNTGVGVGAVFWNWLGIRSVRLRVWIT